MKDNFKESYRKLYLEGQEIFTNFTYQVNGNILGHNCTIRAYQRAWMIHHLAAISSSARSIGLDVMRHSHYFFDGMYRLPSIGMDYMIIYFRPENRFPDYFFGGFARDYKNIQACSMDLFAYLTYHVPVEVSSLPDGWTLTRSSQDEISHFRDFYDKSSGGLSLDAFAIGRDFPGEQSLEQAYRNIGLKRISSTYTLKYNGTTKAYYFVDESDTGLNLSDLINSIKIFIVDGHDLSWEIMQDAICIFRDEYNSDEIQVLVFPFNEVKALRIPYNKKYYLWVLNTKFADDYVEYIKHKLKYNLMKYLKFVVLKKLKIKS